jgi:dephospho-CoA kinase
MIRVGITGGIGSGKTTVCKEWERLGAVVFYADEAARELMVNDRNVGKKLIKTFGPQTYHNDGTLNKPYLIAEAFKKGRVEELNRIVHPAVAKAFEIKCAEVEQSGADLIVKEAALLLNNGRPGDLDMIVIVKSGKDNRIRRVVERDGVTEADVKERIEKQPDFDELMNLADYTIENNGTLRELKEKSVMLYNQILEEHT